MLGPRLRGRGHWPVGVGITEGVELAKVGQTVRRIQPLLQDEEGSGKE